MFPSVKLSSVDKKVEANTRPSGAHGAFVKCPESGLVLWKKGIPSQALYQLLGVTLRGVIYKNKDTVIDVEGLCKRQSAFSMLSVTASGSGLCTWSALASWQ